MNTDSCITSSFLTAQSAHNSWKFNAIQSVNGYKSYSQSAST